MFHTKKTLSIVKNKQNIKYHIKKLKYYDLARLNTDIELNSVVNHSLFASNDAYTPGTSVPHPIPQETIPT